jgi:RHS repeat-associated protein
MGRVEKLWVDQVAQPLRFQGQYFDEETRLCYNRFRYFDPATCSFISQDPIGLAGGENMYAYAPNVWGWADPLGLSCENKGKGTLHYYSPESLGQDLPHFSVETAGNKSLHTHQVITDRSGQMQSTTMTHAQGLPSPTKSIDLDLPDVSAAQKLQIERIGENLGPYNPRTNSCLTNAADVLRAGKADIPSSNVKLRLWLKSL